MITMYNGMGEILGSGGKGRRVERIFEEFREREQRVKTS